MVKKYYVYIMASNSRNAIYIGVTNNIKRRTEEHKNGEAKGFSKEYNTHNLVYYEEFLQIDKAITREKQIKKWNRDWKIELIESKNPDWKDLYDQL